MTNLDQGDLQEKELKKTIQPSINGIIELEQWLKEALCQKANQPNTPLHKNNPDEHEYYRLFKHGDMAAIIRLHSAKNPQHIKIWYCSVDDQPAHRSAPQIVKRTIAQFFHDTFKMNQAPFVDLFDKERDRIVAKTLFVNNESPPPDKELPALKKLMQEKIEVVATVGLFHHSKPVHANVDDDSNNENRHTPVKNN